MDIVDLLDLHDLPNFLICSSECGIERTFYQKFNFDIIQKESEGLFSKIHCTNPKIFLIKCVNIITAALLFCILMYSRMHKITYSQHENIFAALCTTYWRLDNWADLSFKPALRLNPAILTLSNAYVLCVEDCVMYVCIWSINMERKDVGI